MRILAVSGSLRTKSSNAAMLRAAARLAPDEVEFVFYDGIGALPHFNPDLDGEGAVAPTNVAAWREAVTAADGLTISSPEYAHGVPGSLKNALDWLVSTPALFDKPVVLINAAPAGGTFAQEALAETLRTMGAQVLDASLLAPFMKQRVDGESLDAAATETLRWCMSALARAIGDANRGATEID